MQSTLNFLSRSGEKSRQPRKAVITYSMEGALMSRTSAGAGQACDMGHIAAGRAPIRRVRLRHHISYVGSFEGYNANSCDVQRAFSALYLNDPVGAGRRQSAFDISFGKAAIRLDLLPCFPDGMSLNPGKFQLRLAQNRGALHNVNRASLGKVHAGEQITLYPN
jgi:hypothetical protein